MSEIAPEASPQISEGITEQVQSNGADFLTQLTANYGVVRMPGTNETIPDDHTSFIIYGRMGSGKTSAIIRTAPRPLLLISLDPGGTKGYKEVVKDPENQVYIYTQTEHDDPRNPKSFARLLVLLGELKDKRRDELFATIALDSLSSLEKMAMDVVLAEDKKADFTPAQNHYNPMMKRVEYAITLLLGLKAHIVLTAHEDVYRNPNLQISERTISATGKDKDRLPLKFDEIYHQEVLEGQRVFRCASSGDVQVRSRLAALQKFPDLLPADFSRILEKAGYNVVKPKPID